MKLKRYGIFLLLSITDDNDPCASSCLISTVQRY